MYRARCDHPGAASLSGGSLLGRLRATTTAATQPLLLILCVLGLTALTIAAFRWQEIAGWATLGVALLLLEARLDRDLDSSRP
jgi:hypothetical protein